ncbi:lipid A deacylase LpxR family protein [Flavobacterium sp. MAH-1]|uniref:Lipid A deacylase LpxR family protein n=1 Tax=Flavobacterium agri TaxID=2743471 RepID=A0A7Y8Y2P3_9FLAO|nr:lipid A deacylase LpxR family protein [Flavobacterium agri]NUY81429.1 lipid A deacylase LpxR family protein [Flavobacterium agri]NYA71453.1 lipid A deacylase LpxR family protein [Flavobacterium agri]
MRTPIFFLLFCSMVFAQKKQIGAVFENDLYTSSVNDKYYTNGIEFYYKYLSSDTIGKAVKKINEVRIGQYIYNPQTVKAADPGVHDRPFAGYLFGQFQKGWFYKKESVFKLTAQVGVIGPSSMAEEVQRGIHGIFNYKPVQGWDYQIHDLIALQLNAFYSNPILKSEYIDLHAKANVFGGTAFVGTNASLLSRISLKPLLDIYDSALYGASVNFDPDAFKNQSEFFFYIAPGFNYQAYDATIEGSMFNDDSPITWDLVRARFIGEAGFKYRKNQWDLSYAFVYRGKEVDNWVNKGYFFGSIQVAWLIK